MNALAERKWSTLLFNPFVYFAGARALGLGLAGIAAAGAAALASHTHFDGVLDLHCGAPAPVAFIFAEGFIDWLCLALVLAACGQIISKTNFRLIDVLGTQALARWPTVLMALLTLPPAFANYSRELVAQVRRNPQQLPPLTPDAIYFFTATLVMLPLLVWLITLMYCAFSVSCNVRSAKAVVTFILGLILAEIISKIVMYGLMR